MTDSSREELIEQIFDLTTAMYKMLIPGLPLEQLPADVTVSQLRVLLALHTGGPSRMSSLAVVAGVVPSTATGIIDALVRKGLVLREHDSQDRRQVICRMSSEGEKLTGILWTWGKSQIKSLLETLTMEQLRHASEGVELVYRNAIEQKGISSR